MRGGKSCFWVAHAWIAACVCQERGSQASAALTAALLPHLAHTGEPACPCAPAPSIELASRAVEDHRLLLGGALHPAQPRPCSAPAAASASPGVSLPASSGRLSVMAGSISSTPPPYACNGLWQRGMENGRTCGVEENGHMAHVLWLKQSCWPYSSRFELGTATMQ